MAIQKSCNPDRRISIKYFRMGRILLGSILCAVFLLLPCQVFAVNIEWKYKRAALLEETPEIYQDANGLHGSMSLDGYPMTITPETMLRAAPASRHTSFPIFSGKAPLPSRLLLPNTWVASRSTLSTNHFMVAHKLYCLPNHTYPDEKKFLRRFTPQIEAPDYGNHVPGSIQYKNGDTIKILPDKTVQEFISHLGMELVPKYQKDLIATDPTKINFRFFVVDSFKHTHKNDLVVINGEISGNPGMGNRGIFARRFLPNTQKRNSIVDDVIGMPDGVIIISELTLSRLKNQSQVSALLSYAITSIIQKHAYYAWMALSPK